MNTNSGPLAGSIIEGRASSGLRAVLVIVRAITQASAVAPASSSCNLRLRL
ncbi:MULTISPECIES: hypothetical protein [Pseudomonas]|jgi:hypothetical protein|uniref:hypothetical protein n=1 Tax=Pseudomonas TaxID=286 RepID=UPI00209E1284|nr:MULTISPECIES: hypothetical protein [Pseudomonas]MCP1623646.1 hypothetical protein [Pseudomonas nitroreducens]MDN6858953.1 hypothetical protein [Pseudomonas sp. CAN1]